MTYQGRDPERDSRRAGDPHGDSRRAGATGPAHPHGPDGPRGAHAAGQDAGEFVLGADGQPLRDRYGRPVRRRPSAQRANPTHSSSRAQRPGAQRSRPEETRFDVDAYMAQHASPRPARQQSMPARESAAGVYRRNPDAPPRSYSPQTASRGRPRGARIAAARRSTRPSRLSVAWAGLSSSPSSSWWPSPCGRIHA